VKNTAAVATQSVPSQDRHNTEGGSNTLKNRELTLDEQKKETTKKLTKTDPKLHDSNPNLVDMKLN
jgi:hypothetical protein